MFKKSSNQKLKDWMFFDCVYSRWELWMIVVMIETITTAIKSL